MPVDDKHPLSAFQACVVPRKSQDGKIVGATTILTDVSPRKQAQEQVVSLNQQLEQQLQDMQKSKEEAEKSREQAQKAEESVTNFLANMSHELRTPLNTILATVELLAISKPALSAEQVELINLIDRHGHDLLRLLNGILDFSKMEAGKMVIRSQPFDLHQLLYDLRDLMSPAMVTNNNSFCLSLHPDVPRFVEGDRQAIYRVILNLLSNACKFTEKGQVSLRVVLDGGKDTSALCS
jgi:signal transduction histidine kinase